MIDRGRRTVSATRGVLRRMLTLLQGDRNRRCIGAIKGPDNSMIMAQMNKLSKVFLSYRVTRRCKNSNWTCFVRRGFSAGARQKLGFCVPCGGRCAAQPAISICAAAQFLTHCVVGGAPVERA